MADQLKELIKLFSRLGITAFGGPAAHIAMMRHEVVSKKQWMDNSQFMNLVGLTNLIPGPNSTELAIHIGKDRAGWRGLLAAGACFILPAVLITGCIAWLYKKYGTLPEVEPFIYGIRPAIIAVIVMAVYPLAKASVKNYKLAIIGALALVLAFIGLQEILVMFGLGLVYMLYSRLTTNNNLVSILPILSLTPEKVISNTSLFLIFLKIGAILYGSGYVLFAFVDEELVVRGILSRQQLIDAISVGQFTPGPVFSSVTFIGYQVNGFMGAVAATLGVFIPSFVFVAVLNRFKDRLMRSKLFASFLDAVNVASVAVIAVVCWQMGQESITDWQTISIALTSLILLLAKPKLNSAYIVLFGSIAGYLLNIV